jgi:hypothetical protein
MPTISPTIPVGTMIGDQGTVIGGLTPQGSGGMTYWTNNTSVSTVPTQFGKEYAIQGQMFVTNYIVDNVELEDHAVNLDDIKKRLVNQLTEELFQSKLVEFTKSEDCVNGKTAFRARIFAVPDTMVRILRENGK